MRTLLPALAVLALSSPALALDPVRNPDAPVPTYTKPKATPGQRAVRSAPQSQPADAPAARSRQPAAADVRRKTRGAGGGWDPALEARIAHHAANNGIPLELARRVVRIESNGNPRAVSKGNYGLMQIRLGTARAMGYKGDAKGLLDADTNMTYAMRYLAGAYRAASGNADGAIRLYQRGYYYEAKRQGFSPYAPPTTAATPTPPIRTSAQ